jgi:hypothetical protein
MPRPEELFDREQAHLQELRAGQKLIRDRGQRAQDPRWLPANQRAFERQDARYETLDGYKQRTDALHAARAEASSARIAKVEEFRQFHSQIKEVLRQAETARLAAVTNGDVEAALAAHSRAETAAGLCEALSREAALRWGRGVRL